MELILQIVTDPAYTVSKQMLRVFGPSGGTIGRALDNYWVIPDPKHYVSARHCVIEHDGVAFWLRDTSRNGVIINGAGKRIDPAHAVQIHEGDRIRFGLYEIVAHIRDRRPAVAAEPEAVQEKSPPTEPQQPPEPVAAVPEPVPPDAEPPVAGTPPATDTTGEQPIVVDPPVVEAAPAAEPAVVTTPPATDTTGEQPIVVDPPVVEPAPVAAAVPVHCENQPVVAEEAESISPTGEHPVQSLVASPEPGVPGTADDASAATQALDELVLREAGTRRVKIDESALRQSGLLPPEAEQRLIANQFRHIKRGVLLRARGKGEQSVPDGRMVMVTSSLPGEGKTFCAMNLALSLAREKGLRTLLVDSDVAKPKLSRFLGVGDAPGLMDLLGDDALDAESLILPTDRDALSVLPAGRTHEEDATELLASVRMTDVAARLLRDDPDRILLFDAPPLLLTNEARVLAGVVGQVLLVVAAGSTPRAAVDEAVQYVAEEKFVGLILNQSKANRPGSYYGYGDYGYGGYG